MKKIIFLIAVFTFAIWGCEKDSIVDPVSIYDLHKPVQETVKKIYPRFNPGLTYDSVTDIDGNIYKTIKIGDQIWMAENLRTTRYKDGSPVYLGKGDMAGETDWFDLRSGAYCWYFNDSVNKSMGAIYNWFAIETGKLAPEGWHVPSNSDWGTLINNLGGESLAHNMLLSTGTNESGFTAIPSPIVCGWGFGPEISFWSATPGGGYGSLPYAHYFSIWEENMNPKVSLFSDPQSFGFCVRCLKDNNP